MSTRTAPAVTGAASYRRASFSLLDYVGKIRTDSYDLPVAVTAALIEAYAAALQAISNASLYKVELTDVWNSVGDTVNATESPVQSVSDNLAILLKTAANSSKTMFVPAPENSVFIETTTDIDPEDTDLAAYFTAAKNMLDAGTPSWEIVSARFTERRKTGKAIKV